MKKTLFLTAGIFCFFLCSALHIDSLKIIKANDTAYYFAVYGAVIPAGPATIIDSAIYIGADSINVRLCYEASSGAGLIYRVSDSIYIGHLSGSNYHVSFYFTITDSVHNTCSTTNMRDSFELSYIIAGMAQEEPQIFPSLFPVPAYEKVRCLLPKNAGPTTITITTLEGSLYFERNYTGVENTEIDIAAFPPAVYLVQFATGNRYYIKKVKQ